MKLIVKDILNTNIVHGKALATILFTVVLFFCAIPYNVSPASITAYEFYRKLGYTYKNGIDAVDEEQLFRLEKFR